MGHMRLATDDNDLEAADSHKDDNDNEDDDDDDGSAARDSAGATTHKGGGGGGGGGGGVGKRRARGRVPDPGEVWDAPLSGPLVCDPPTKLASSPTTTLAKKKPRAVCTAAQEAGPQAPSAPSHTSTPPLPGRLQPLHAPLHPQLKTNPAELLARLPRTLPMIACAVRLLNTAA